MNVSSNPAILLRKILRDGKKSHKTILLFLVILFLVGASLAFLPTGNYYFERLGQIILGLCIMVYYFLDAEFRIEAERNFEKRIEKAEKEAEQHPEKASPFWQMAQNRLELYFRRNLSQSKSIYWITVFVMIAGFILIGYGVSKAFEEPKIDAALLTTVTGVLTEFIAATFLVIYKSTLVQANKYVRTLERINAVGMAIQIVDTIPSEEKEIKNKSKTELATRIIDLFSDLDNEEKK